MQSILAAAVLEFSEKGYDGAGVDRIAAKAGVNKGMLYYHFASKRGLYLARRIADGPGDAPSKLEAWVAAVIEEAAARPWFPSIMLREVASGAPRLDPETFGLLNSVYGAVRDLLAQGQQEGAFDDVDPLLTHLTVLPPILIFFARQRVLDAHRGVDGVGEARTLDDFVRHMQRAALRIVAKASDASARSFLVTNGGTR
jgi:TetR/AcrR family transcriptional regulator